MTDIETAARAERSQLNETITSLEKDRAELVLVCQTTVAKMDSEAKERERSLQSEREELIVEREAMESRLGSRQTNSYSQINH